MKGDAMEIGNCKPQIQSREFLNPREKLLTEVVDRLASRVKRTPAGVPSLSHVLVVVSTAQTGRRLRAALAQKLGGVLAPSVLLPSAFLSPSSPDLPEADETTSLAILAKVIKAKFGSHGPATNRAAPPSSADAIELAAGYLKVWRILGENALLMRDVARLAPSLLKGEGMDCEVARWQELADLEADFLAAIHSAGFSFCGESAALAVADPPKFPGITEIILPALLSPTPAFYRVLEATGIPVTVMIHADESDAASFDQWGRVLPSSPIVADTRIPSGAVQVFATPGAEAAAAADFFAAVKPDEALPALTLADRDLFPEVESAFTLRGLTIHNPARSLIAMSSLGRLAKLILALTTEPRYDLFSALLRQGDVQRWLSAELALSRDAMAQILCDLDELKTSHLPETLADVRAFAVGDLKRVSDLVAAKLNSLGDPVCGVRDLLAEIFANRELDEAKPEDREFAAAAATLNDLFDSFDALNGLADPSDSSLLFARALDSAGYSLEPDSGDAIQTDGWLEVPFLAEDEILVAGFQEGCVPESVVGHPFLPDSFRTGLGLVTNDMRSARDAFILRETVTCRTEGFVRISLHSTAADGSALKPSRLLLRTPDDTELTRRAMRLYTLPAAESRIPARSLPQGWQLQLPSPDAASRLFRTTPSAIDTYLKCPFTYFLKTTFGERMDDSAEEMDAATFGSLIHDALDLWAKRDGSRHSSDPAQIARDLSRRLDELVSERFGASPSAIVALQADSARRRLEAFAERQAEWRRRGWRIVKTELPMRVVYDGVEIRGRCDRIDANDLTGEVCVIDYKTWDRMDRANPLDGSKRAVDFALSRGLPVVEREDGAFAWRSLQLPVYCAMVEASQGFAGTRLENVLSCYCVLGASAAETGFSKAVRAADCQTDAERLLRRLLADIAHGIFWPPSTEDLWRFDYGGLLFDSPQRTVSTRWLDDQMRRLAGGSMSDGRQKEGAL